MMALLPEVIGNKFLYFGFGSNLLSARIHIENKSAVRRTWGRLKNFKLDFNIHSTRWNGAAATVVPKIGHHVCGAIWEIDLCDMPSLDRQEGVADKVYIPLSLPIETVDGETLTCRVYQLTKSPDELPENSEIPFERQPSLTYLKTIIKGAIETNIDEDYIKLLKLIKHNGNIIPKFEKDFELDSVSL